MAPGWFAPLHQRLRRHASRYSLDKAPGARDSSWRHYGPWNHGSFSRTDDFAHDKEIQSQCEVGSKNRTRPGVIMKKYYIDLQRKLSVVICGCRYTPALGPFLKLKGLED